MSTLQSLIATNGTWEFLKRNVTIRVDYKEDVWETEELLFDYKIPNEEKNVLEPTNEYDSNLRFTFKDNGEVIQQKDPCEPVDGRYRYPFNFDCSLGGIADKDGKIRLDFPLGSYRIVDLKQLCNEFYIKFWCAKNQVELDKLINDFINDVSNLIQEVALDSLHFVDNYGRPLNRKYFTGKINRISRELNTFKKKLKTQHSDEWFALNQKSCLCGGKEPTYCCYPEQNSAICYCSKGVLRNLCEPCYKQIELILPHILYYPVWSASTCEWGGYGEDRRSHQQGSKVFITIKKENGEIFEGQNNIKMTDDASRLKRKKIGYNDFELYLPYVKVPLNELCYITIVIIGPCKNFDKACCEKSGWFKGKWTFTIRYHPKDGSPYLLIPSTNPEVYKVECIPCK